MTFSRLGMSVGFVVGVNLDLQDLEDTSGLFVDQAGDTLDTSSSSETSDSGLGNTPKRVSHCASLKRW
jgi:hypothetical protein